MAAGKENSPLGKQRLVTKTDSETDARTDATTVFTQFCSSGVEGIRHEQSHGFATVLVKCKSNHPTFVSAHRGNEA